MSAQRWFALLGLSALALASAACTVGVAADYPPGAYEAYPPDTFIATTDPIYFDGRASYWYGNRWYYRDGNRWNYYQHEPAELARRRVSAPPARRTYEHYTPHPGGGRVEAHPVGHAGNGHGHH
ncbi:MAG: hypothetical protein WDO69_13420 [Pseudomonadota bacterium]